MAQRSGAAFLTSGIVPASRWREERDLRRDHSDEGWIGSIRHIQLFADHAQSRAAALRAQGPMDVLSPQRRNHSSICRVCTARVIKPDARTEARMQQQAGIPSGCKRRRTMLLLLFLCVFTSIYLDIQKYISPKENFS